MQRAQRALHQTNKNRNKWNTSRRLSRTPYLFWYKNINVCCFVNCVDSTNTQSHTFNQTHKHHFTVHRIANARQIACDAHTMFSCASCDSIVLSLSRSPIALHSRPIWMLSLFYMNEITAFVDVMCFSQI